MNKKLTVVVVLFMLVVVTGFSVSGTYAKYTSQFTATSDARVAKWIVSVGGVNGTSQEQNFTFNLFDYVDANVDVDGDGTERVIAPGTTGNIPTVAIVNDSEVMAEYTVEYTITNAGNIPVEFSTDGTTWVTPTAGKISAPATAINMNGGTANIGLAWRWAFEGTDSTNFTTTQTDETDTDLGVAATATITVDAKVVVTQID